MSDLNIYPWNRDFYVDTLGLWTAIMSILFIITTLLFYTIDNIVVIGMFFALMLIIWVIVAFVLVLGMVFGMVGERHLLFSLKDRPNKDLSEPLPNTRLTKSL